MWTKQHVFPDAELTSISDGATILASHIFLNAELLELWGLTVDVGHSRHHVFTATADLVHSGSQRRRNAIHHAQDEPACIRHEPQGQASHGEEKMEIDHCLALLLRVPGSTTNSHACVAWRLRKNAKITLICLREV